MITQEPGNKLCQQPPLDESGDTASSTNRSCAETYPICNHVNGLIDSVKTVDSFFHRTKPNLARITSDDTSPLSEWSSEQVNEPPSQKDQGTSSAHDFASLSSHEMRNELGQIELKIKAAIDHNSRVHSNSIELKSVLRKSLSGHVNIPLEVGGTSLHQLVSLCDPDLESERVLPAANLDEISNQSSNLEGEEIRMLKQQLADTTAELTRVNATKIQGEILYATTISKLKKELRSSKELIHKLQTEKLADMERKFTVSLDLLETKLSEEINSGDDVEQKLAIMKEERDTARALNLPLFNDLKKLYAVKSGLEEANHGLQRQVEELAEKERLANENVKRLSNDIRVAQMRYPD